MPGEDVLHHVRRLRALIDGQALPRPGFQSATMARGSRVTPVWRPNTNVASTTASASAKALSTVAGVERALEGEIVAELGMDHRRRRRRAPSPHR